MLEAALYYSSPGGIVQKKIIYNILDNDPDSNILIMLLTGIRYVHCTGEVVYYLDC